jgi:hypothetical protein
MFALAEAYTAVATALDHSTRVPSWEPKLGWFLIALPCELLIALVLLMRRKRVSLGFRLVGTNLIVYAAFMCFEVVRVRESLDKTMLAVACLWSAFFALAIGAAHILKLPRRRDSRLSL